ncbi:MAG: YncE family protein, partial [Thermoplasmata archaeon]
MLSTIDTVANRSIPGDATVAAQNNPQYGVYDTDNGQIYIRNSEDSEAPLAAINPTTNRVIADITTPGGALGALETTTTIAVDNATGYLYATNAAALNVSVIDGATDYVTGSVSVGGVPDGIAYDPVNHDLYVADSGSHNVTVISAASNRSVASIQVGTSPTAIIWDSTLNRVFVANDGSSNVTAINPTTNKVLFNTTTAAYPIAFAMDTVDGYLDVLTLTYGGSLGRVDVIDASSGALKATLHVGSSPEALAYDPSVKELFVANSASENVSVFNQPADTTNGTIPIGEGNVVPLSIVYDPVGGDVYVSSYVSANVSIINPTLNKIAGTVSTNGLGPWGLTVDNATGDLYSLNEGTTLVAPTATVISPTTHAAIDTFGLATYSQGFTYESPGNLLALANEGGDNTYFLNASTYRESSIVPAGYKPVATAFDNYTQDTYTLNSEVPENITVVNAAGLKVTSISAVPEPYALAFDPYTNDIYLTQQSGFVVPINGTTHTAGTSIRDNGSSPWAIVYDPHNHDVYVSNEGSSNVTIIGPANHVIGSIPVGSEPYSLAFDPKNNTVWVANYGSNNISVINDTTQKVAKNNLLSTAGELLAYDPSNNAVYVALSTPDDVRAFNASSYQALAGSPLALTTDQTVGWIGYDPSTCAILVSMVTNGTIYPIGACPGASYPVSFMESTLAPSTAWSVTLQGSRMTSISPVIGFTELAGTYEFNIGTIPGYTSTPSYGSITVPDPHQPINISFTSEFGPATPVSALYAVYNGRPDLQAAYPNAFTNFTNYTKLVDWAGGVVSHAFSDSNYSDLSPFGYWFALMMSFNGRSDLQEAFADAFGNLSNYTHLANWAGGVVAGEWVDSANATLSPFGYYYDLMNVYDGRTDLQAAFPDAFTNFDQYTLLVNWAGGVVNQSWTDSAYSTLHPFGYYYALKMVYDGRSDLQSAFPNAFTNGVSYQSLLAWAKGVVMGPVGDDSAYSTLVKFA